MMKNRFKIFHFIVLVLLLIILLRFDRLYDLTKLYFSFFNLTFSSTVNINSLIDFRMVDGFLSLILFLVFTVILFSSKKVRYRLSDKLNFSSAILILLAFGFLFAPIIADNNPEFQQDIVVTKLCPPLSSVKYIKLKNSNANDLLALENFKKNRNKALPATFNEEILFIDSIKKDSFINNNKLSDEIVIYQKDYERSVALSKIETKNNLPVIYNYLYLLGTDEFGRDIFSRVVYGSRISVIVGASSVLLSFFIGILFAFISVHKGGIIDLILSRITDLFLSFPAIFLVVLILALFGNNIFSVIIVLGLSGWMSLYKIAKTEMILIRKKDYYISSQLIGLSKSRLLLNEMLPVLFIPISVNLVFQFSNVVLAEAALSYLGLGVGSDYPSWGSMIQSGQQYLSQSWWLIFIPGSVLIIILLSINNLASQINRRINSRLNV